MSARFEEAVRLAERRSWTEFARLVAHLTERISGTSEDGTPKVFRDSAINNLGEFFERFRELNVRNNEQLDALVGEAQRVVRGVERPGAARQRRVARAGRVSQLSRVQSSLDAMLVERPRRRILRPAAAAGGGVMDLIIGPTGRVRAHLLRGDRPRRARPPRDRPRQPRRARPRRPLVCRPLPRPGAGARPVRPSQRGPGRRARLARRALARGPRA